jgi:type VI secretion system protein ImpF
MAGFLPTLFERLSDEAPHRTGEMNPLRRWNVEELKASVAADLEALLNTRASLDDSHFSLFPEARNSVAGYGMGDFVGLSLANSGDRDLICRTLERAIAFHEPRLRHVEVRLETDRSSIGCLQFGINAVLYVNPASEPVTFDALLQPNTLQYSVARSRSTAGVR